ncbi:MAG: hypothetical protein FJX54_08305 [Alphaproteobacteria bacterium]|nr:hypothetical protein [Alphaproteobacteria bacterium]
MDKVRLSAQRVHAWIAEQSGDPLDMLKRMKFEPVGYHPVEGYALNVIEQINQTWTFAVAIAAARQLLGMHPEAEGFYLAPGAHASRPLDIMSTVELLVGAETCAVVHPRSNKRLKKDLGKLSARPEAHRYAFFYVTPIPWQRAQNKA